MKKTLTTFLDAITVGTEQTWKNLSLFPLISATLTNDLDCLLLDEALEKGCINISEIDEGGSVPELKLHNQSDQMVLLLDGEELVGAKQNRIVNTTILIAPQTTTVIPVSCCEQGRWEYNSPKFSTANRVMSPRMRAGKTSQVSESLRTRDSYQADQSAIWSDIEDRAMRREACSPSMAMAAIYEKEKPDIEEFRSHFHVAEDQVGIVVAIEGKIVGLDCFSHRGTLSKVFEKMVDSYALDAIDWVEPDDRSSEQNGGPEGFIEALRAASSSDHRSVGLGNDIRFESEVVSGFALIHEKNLIHLSAFTQSGDRGQKLQSTRVQRFSSRRSRHRS